MATSLWRNWAGTEEASPTRIIKPSKVKEIIEAVRSAAGDGSRLKAVGAGHSFSGIACPAGAQLDLSDLDGVVNVDADSGRVTVEAGMPLWRLNQVLDAHGLAMENLGDIDRQTVSGAISTGTHGTGDRYRGLATQVHSLRLVLADGSIVRCSAEQRPELFAAARIGLGALGIIAEVTLQCVPAFQLQAIETPMRLDTVLGGLDEMVAENDHFEFYWFPHTDRTLSKQNNRFSLEERMRRPTRLGYWWNEGFTENTLFEASNRVGTRFPQAVPNLNRLAGRVWSARNYSDVSHKVFTSPRKVVFREMEYAVPREALPKVLAELKAKVEDGLNVSFPVEVRFAAADDVWMSTAYGRKVAYIAVHQYHRHPHEEYFQTAADIFDAADGRPHWGKMHSLDAKALSERYDRFEDFLKVRDQVDPDRMFTNPYLERVLGD